MAHRTPPKHLSGHRRNDGLPLVEGKLPSLLAACLEDGEGDGVAHLPRTALPLPVEIVDLGRCYGPYLPRNVRGAPGKRPQSPFTEAPDERCVTWSLRALRSSGRLLPQCPTAEHLGRSGLLGTRGREVLFPAPSEKETGEGAGVPPFQSGFPAFTARSSRVQYNSKSGRSCSPS